MIKQKIGKCSECEQSAPEQPLIAGKCKTHYWQFRSTKWKKSEPKEIKPIPKFSKKREKENREYTIKRLQFLAQPENLRCFIDGCNKRADSIEHIRGRKGFADDWARENNVSLLLDVRFWKPCCNEHNLELERNPELSQRYQLSKITGKEKLKK